MLNDKILGKKSKIKETLTENEPRGSNKNVQRVYRRKYMYAVNFMVVCSVLSNVYTIYALPYVVISNFVVAF